MPDDSVGDSGSSIDNRYCDAVHSDGPSQADFRFTGEQVQP
jgi:hypothetical protein